MMFRTVDNQNRCCVKVRVRVQLQQERGIEQRSHDWVPFCWGCERVSPTIQASHSAQWALVNQSHGVVGKAILSLLGWG